MTDPSDRSIIIRLSVDQTEQAEFLQGLDNWLQLGLLSDWQVRQLCQQHLSCPLPTPTTLPQSVAEEFAGEFEDATDFANASASASSPSARLPVPTRIGRSLQAFMAEISVIWLLFLGVFLVVVSSGVLAASQWQNFSPVGQYGILFTYTLAFFATGLWTGQRSNLRLTARMLQITTLLIIPVNFWMMDGLGLWQSSLGIVFECVAALILTVIPLVLLHPQSELLQTNHPRLSAFNSIGLSWLHWGWGIAAIPLIATYVGTIATAYLLGMRQQRGERRGRGGEDRGDRGEEAHQYSASSASSASPIPTPQSPTPNPPSLASPATLVIALSTLLLIGRALLVAEVPPRQLGLALGICGWLWCWLSRPAAPELTVQQDRSVWTPAVWTPAGVALLLLGWAISVGVDPPWQAIAISGLGLWLLVDRLRSTGRSEVLLASFLVGLQAYGLLWRLFPVDFRQNLIDFAAQIVGNAALPQVLIGLAGFPYLWLTLSATNWLKHRRQEPEGRGQEPKGREQATSNSAIPNFRSLVQQTETIAFILGICLSLISLANPGVRSLNLLLAVCTLIWVIWNRPTGSPALIYLTHITGLAAIVSGIDWILPALAPIQWAAVFLGMMAIEWGLSIGTTASQWRRSAWYMGLALAGLGYVALLAVDRDNQTSIWQTLVWLITPGLLTGLSRLRQFPQVRLAAWLSTAALCAQLLLLSSLNTWIAAFAAGTLLMWVNSYTLQRLVPAALTIGFALGLEATLVWRWLAVQITSDTIVIFLAAVLWQLWLLRDWLLRDQPLQNGTDRSQTDLNQTDLNQIYATAVIGWGLAIGGFTLLLLTGFSAIAFALREITGQQMVGVSLVIGAIGYQVWRQPTNLGFWGLAWAVETGIAILIARSGSNVEALGIANLGLGLVCQLAGEHGGRRSPHPRSSWHWIPLTYAALGLLWVHSTFTAFTGLYTLIAALTGIGVGRRYARFQPLTLLAILLGSVAAYELLVYQLLQSESGNAGDGFTLLAGLSILIAWSDRLFSRWLLPYLRLTHWQLQLIAHGHWLIGSGLALLAVFNGLSSIGTVLLIATAIALSSYALVMGNFRWNQEAVQEAAGRGQRAEGKENSSFTLIPLSSHATWTYAGIAELLATISYGLYEAIPDTGFLMAWAGAIASVVAVGLYLPPWNRWGWSVQPWRDAAAVFPAIAIIVTVWNVALQSLLITAAFYAWFAKATRQIRLSYLSILLFDWALLRYVHQQGWLNLLWVSTVVGGSLLYVAQIDPTLQAQSARTQRHWLRSLSTGLICLTAFYQAEVETGGTAIGVGMFTLGLGVALIFAGLLLRIRAFLYVGTATFILRILRWLWLFVNSYSLLLWAVGIVLGLVFIWIAATFESRRSQVNAMVHYWSSELENWE